MPAHLPRRSFATPFIVTVVAACGGSSENVHANPPAPDTAAPAASAAPSAPPAETAPAPTASASVTPPARETTYTVTK
ncbi:MAG TPA: hypothetical protein VGH28_25025 [Polyangiaceae bacterium]